LREDGEGRAAVKVRKKAAWEQVKGLSNGPEDSTKRRMLKMCGGTTPTYSQTFSSSS
jgi:hypothetical protein